MGILLEGTDPASNNYVGQNQILILGSGAYALRINTFCCSGDKAVSNLFVGNNIARFESSVADVFFDANAERNISTGDSGTVTDLGTGNVITGHTKKSLSGGLGQFKDAQAAKWALLRALRAIEAKSKPSAK